MTLVDPEQLLSSNFLGILRYFAFLGGNKRLKEWRQTNIVCDGIILLTESTFQRCTDYVEIARRS